MRITLITFILFLTQLSFGQKNNIDTFLTQITDSTKTFKYQMVEVGGIDETGKEFRLKKEFRSYYNKTGGYTFNDGCNDCQGNYIINNNNIITKSLAGVCTEAYCTPEFFEKLAYYDVTPSKMDYPYISFKKIGPSYFEVRGERLFFISKFQGVLNSGESKITEEATIYEKVKDLIIKQTKKLNNFDDNNEELYLIENQSSNINNDFFHPVSLWKTNNGKLDFVRSIYPGLNNSRDTLINYNKSKFDIGNIFYSQELNKLGVSYMEYNKKNPHNEKLVFLLLNVDDASLSKFKYPKRGKSYYNSFFVESKDSTYIKYGLFGSEIDSFEYSYINTSTKQSTNNKALKNENIMQSGNGFYKMNGPGIQVEDYLDNKIYSSKTSLAYGFKKGILIGDLSTKINKFKNPNNYNRVLKLCSNSSYEIYYLKDPYKKSTTLKTCTYFIKDKINNKWSSLSFETYTRINLFNNFLCWTTYNLDSAQINIKNLDSNLISKFKVAIDNEILCVDAGKTIYYRENDAIFSYHFNNKKSKLLVKDPKVVNIHWAFIKKTTKQ